MKSILIISSIFIHLNCLFSQTTNNDISSPFIDFGPSTFVFGSNYGIQPNYTTNRGVYFFYGEIDQKIKIKGLPIRLSGRISDEPFRTGRPSYFRVKYEAFDLRKQQILLLKDSINQISSTISSEKSKLFELESHLSYLNLSKDWNQNPILLSDSIDSSIPSIPTVSIDSLNLPKMGVDSIEINQLQIPDVDLPKQLTQLQELEKSIDLKSQTIKQFEFQKEELELQLDELSNKRNLSFINGVKKVDLGLSSVSQSSMSRNAVPIQGIHVAGEVKQLFYDGAVGFTMPNQLFSSQAFDQVINNTSNVFNASNFFAVNSNRFISSAVLGLGQKEKRSISSETFYLGSSWEQISKKQNGNQSLTSNISGVYQFNRIPLKLHATIGKSLLGSDSLSTSFFETISYSGDLFIKLDRIRGEFTSLYRKIGASFDGMAQGLYLKGTEHIEFSYKESFTRNFSSTFRYSEDRFFSQSTTNNLRSTKQSGIDIKWKVFQNTAFTANYTLLQTNTDSSASRSNLSHLARVGIYNSRQFKNMKWLNSFDLGSAYIKGLDSIQTLTQSSFETNFKYEKWLFGAKLTYNRFSGIQRLYGENIIIQPQVAYQGKQFELEFKYQYLVSEQFGKQNGCVFSTTFHASENLSWHVSGQRWLPTELVYFNADTPSFIKPWFIRLRITLKLNVKK